MAEPREWTVDRTSGGWTLVFDPPTSYMIEDRVTSQLDGPNYGAARMIAFTFIFAGIGITAAVQYIARNWVQSLLVVGAVVIVFLIVNYLLGESDPGPKPSSFAQVVKVERGELITPDGYFKPHYLSSLRTAEEGAAPGRRLLVFESSSMKNATFIGWPGLPEPEALELIEQIQSVNSENVSVGC